MNLPFFIARRYFFSKRNTSAVNIITGISVMGYAVGAFALMVLLSALNGFERMIFKVYENYYPDLKIVPVHGKVFETDSALMLKIARFPGVRAASAVLEENAVVEYGDKQVVALIKGVEPAWLRVIRADSMVVAGEPAIRDSRGHPLGWMAEGLVYKLALGRESSRVNVMAPRRETVGVSQMDMTEDELAIGAMIRAGEEMDQKLVVAPLDWAAELFERTGYVSGLELAVTNQGDLSAVRDGLSSMLGPGYRVRDRYQQNEAVYKMFNTEKWVAFSIMSFVLLLISFNLVGSLSMLVLEKKNDISLLSHLGMRARGIRGIFFREGLIVALAGTLVGLILGICAVWLQQRYGFITTQSSFAAVYPVELRYSDVLLILLLSASLGVSSAVYPALKSARKA